MLKNDYVSRKIGGYSSEKEHDSFPRVLFSWVVLITSLRQGRVKHSG